MEAYWTPVDLLLNTIKRDIFSGSLIRLLLYY
jgi:hypothetical protein